MINIDLRPYSITGEEIRRLADAKLASYTAALDKLGATEAADQREVAYYSELLVVWKEERAELQFFRDHIADGPHSVTSHELAMLRMNTQPIEVPDLRQRAADSGLQRKQLNESLTTVGALRGYGSGGRLL